MYFSSSVCTKYPNMISFAAMTIVLAVMACMVHYDLLGLMSNYHPYRQRTYVQFDEQHERHYYPVLEFDKLWTPKPGTDAHDAYYFKPTVLVNNFDNNDNDDFWSVGSDDDRDSENDDFWYVGTDDDEDNKPANIESTSSSPSNTGVCNDNDAVTWTCFFGSKSDTSDKTNQQPSQSNFHTALTPVSNIILTSSLDSHYSDYDEDDSDYYAPGEERDDDVF